MLSFPKNMIYQQKKNNGFFSGFQFIALKSKQDKNNQEKEGEYIKFNKNANKDINLQANIVLFNRHLLWTAKLKDSIRVTLFPFLEALKQNKFVEAETMLRYGLVDLFIKDSKGQTALMFAARYGSTKHLLLCLKNGAHVHTADVSGECALMHACGPNVKQADQKIYILCQNNSYANDWNIKLMTPLMKCAINNHPNACKVLLQFNAYPEFKDDSRRTALIYASERGNFDCVRELVNFVGYHRVKINTVSGDGQTAIMKAIIRGDEPMILFLMSQPSLDLFTMDGKGQNMFMIAPSSHILTIMLVAIANHPKTNGNLKWKKLIRKKMLENFPKVKTFFHITEEYSRRLEEMEMEEVN